MTYFKDIVGAAALAGAVLVPPAAMAITDPSAPTPSEQTREEAQAQHVAEVCAKTTCRTEVREIRLKTTDGDGFSMKTQLFPYDDDGTVILYPGEAIEVDVAADGKAAVPPRFVKVIDHVDADNGPRPRSPAGAAGETGRAKLAIEFRQEPDKPDMTLVFRSDLRFPVKYDAIILVPTKDGFRSGHTTSCPIKAGLVGYERWPFPIAMVVLTDFQVVPASETACN